MTFLEEGFHHDLVILLTSATRRRAAYRNVSYENDNTSY
jgi:hypothetical protein